MKDGQHALWSCKKFKAMRIGERREYVQKARLCFNCFNPAHISKNCTSKPCNISNCGKKHNRLLHYEPKKQETTAIISDATTALATNVTQGGLPVLRIKLTSGTLASMLWLCVILAHQFHLWISQLCLLCSCKVDKHLCRWPGIHGSEDVKTEIVPITVSAADKTRPLSTVQFYVHKNLKLGNQNVDLPELKSRYPNLKKLAR